MKAWLKFIYGFIIVVFCVAIIGGLIFYRTLKSSVADYDGEYSSNKIESEVKIFRDSVGIPYIFSSSKTDVAFALGFVHAQERLFSMDLARRAGEGRLSEVFGKTTIPFDKMFKTIGIKNTAQHILDSMNTEAKKILQAYSDGVNFYLKNNDGKLPVEFSLLGYQPQLWSPLSSIIVVRMMAWELNISWWTDISFTILAQKYGAEKVSEILPDYPENAPTIIPPELSKYPKLSSDFIDLDKNFRTFMGWGGTHIGSNNWVVNASKSSSDKPIIANDTHLAHSVPSRWFFAVLNINSWNISGFTLPGAPGVVIGKNNKIAWAVTNVMNDDADFYLEKLDKNKKKYFFNNSWFKLNISTDTIFVKDSDPIAIKIFATGHGPIISSIHPYSFLYDSSSLSSQEISMSWLGNFISDEVNALYNINFARNFTEFKTALSDFSIPGQNFVYADNENNIGYVLAAKIPKRNTQSSTFVFDGTSNKYDWKGFIPTNEIPFILNTKDGFIASANNKTLKDFKYHISNLWEPSSRIERINSLLNSKPKHDVKDFMKYQNDFVSPYAKQITSFILNAFRNVKIKDENLETSLKLFAQWDFEMNEFEQTPTIYAAFLKFLLKNIFADQMTRNEFNEFVFVANVPYRSLLKVLNDSNSSWIDDVNTNETESVTDIIRKSLTDALDYLEINYGKNIENWQWGQIHQALFKHPFAGISSFVDNIVNIGPFNIGGDGTTIFNTEYSFTDPIKKFPRFDHKAFENNLGPAMRFIYDFNEPDEVYMILTTGQSGNFFSDHYSDLSELWLRGKYVLVKTNSFKNSRATDNVIIIKPL